MSPICFMDTETTGLSLDDDIWEFAAIRREEDGSESEHHMFIQHEPFKCRRLPDSFRADHEARYSPINSVDRKSAAESIEMITAGAHIVGAVPNFDTERLAILLDAFNYKARWHYHLIDVENLAVGYLSAKREEYPGSKAADVLGLPWKSDDLSRACGVEPPTAERHTAMGDAKWARALYDAICESDSR